MKKISFKNIFKKSQSGGNKTGKILFILLIIIIAAGAFYWWGYPLLFPVTSVKSAVTTTATITTPSSIALATKIETDPVVKEKTEFEIEMEKRKKGYDEKIFVYEPYEPPSNRNPFQNVSTSYFLEETAEKEEGEKEGSALRFPKPVLPPGTKLTGIIDSKDNRVAIIVMNEETFIANLYDILLDKYIVKDIKKDEVVLELNDNEFSIKLGGEDLSDEL